MTKSFTKYRFRIRIISLLVISFWIVLCGKLFNVQILQSDENRKKLNAQAFRKELIPAERGNIYDRNGDALTRNLAHYTISINPSTIRDKAALAKDLQKITGKPTEYYIKKLNSEKNFEYLGKNRISFDLQLYPEQMFESADFFGQFPEIPVVIDHAGSPYDQSYSGLKTWKNGIKKLAELPNLHIKLSGFGMYDKNWSSESHQLIFDTILEIFKPNRIMWGSNFPVEKLTHSYSYCIEQLLKWLKPLSKKDKNCITSETATNFYRIENNFKL